MERKAQRGIIITNNCHRVGPAIVKKTLVCRVQAGRCRNKTMITMQCGIEKTGHDTVQTHTELFVPDDYTENDTFLRTGETNANKSLIEIYT